jgi:hypothetical protein
MDVVSCARFGRGEVVGSPKLTPKLAVGGRAATVPDRVSLTVMSSTGSGLGFRTPKPRVGDDFPIDHRGINGWPRPGFPPNGSALIGEARVNAVEGELAMQFQLTAGMREAARISWAPLLRCVDRRACTALLAERGLLTRPVARHNALVAGRISDPACRLSGHSLLGWVLGCFHPRRRGRGEVRSIIRIIAS